MYKKVKTPQNIPLSSDEFFELCGVYPEVPMELDAQGRILVHEPSGSETGKYQANFIGELWLWNRNTQTGYTFESSAGFTLPDGSVRQPDAAWIEKSRYEALSLDLRTKFAPICPDFVAEVRSLSDRFAETYQKCLEIWMGQGAKEAWLIDPQDGLILVFYREGSQVKEEHHAADEMVGSRLLNGFQVELKSLKR